MVLKITTWRPDTHPDHEVEFEWDTASTEDSRVHTGVSVRYPDGTTIHRERHGSKTAHEHYTKVLTENQRKNIAHGQLVATLPAAMKKQQCDSDGDPMYEPLLQPDGKTPVTVNGRPLDDMKKPVMVVKDKHAPQWTHHGDGVFSFHVPGLVDEHYDVVARVLADAHGDKVRLVKTLVLSAVR